MSVKAQGKDIKKPRCLARLSDQEHEEVLAAAKRSGCKSVREWLLQMTSGNQKTSIASRKAKK